MFETYRMLGEQHEANLVRLAEAANVNGGKGQMKNAQISRRTRAAGIAASLAALAMGLAATGVWARSDRSAVDRTPAVQPRDSYWSYDVNTGNPRGPAGQLDFWNYDPETGRRISDYAPGVAPDDLATLWSVER